ncbi:MAG: hypothetical protein II393_04020 [Cytophagales bacterium]|nr:hypothetical protein [Cytophagales bacterium]
MTNNNISVVQVGNEMEYKLINPEIASKIVEFEKMAKEIKEKEDDIKKTILEEMENKGIVKVENDDFIISYVAPTDRETFDTKSFREAYADLYDEFVKLTPVKSSIRIKLK